jgi:hypothetical protein
LAELKGLDIGTLPSPCTVERVLRRHGLTTPRERVPRLLPHPVYPAPHAQCSDRLHEVDSVAPIYPKGRNYRDYILACKGTFDGAVCPRLASSRRMTEVLTLRGECWKSLGLPEQVQFDNAREVTGWRPGARYLSRVNRLCLRYGVAPWFIPPARPRRNGSVEDFNGRFLPRLFQRRFARPGALRRRRFACGLRLPDDQQNLPAPRAVAATSLS